MKVYVSLSGSGAIEVLEMSAQTGALSHAQTVPVGNKVMPLAVSPDQSFLFAGIRGEPYGVASFAINKETGTLTLLEVTPAPSSFVYLSTDHTGRYLLAACNPQNVTPRTGSVAIGAIGRCGPIQTPITTLLTPPKLHSIVADPANQFVLAASCDGDQILRYRLDPLVGSLDDDGLAPVHLPPGSGPRHIKFHPNGRFVFVINEYQASVTVFRYHAGNGKLQWVQTLEAKMTTSGSAIGRAADLQFSPNGRWLYTTVRRSQTLAAFTVNGETGQTTCVGEYETLEEARSLCVDPGGRFIIVAGVKSDALAIYAINKNDGLLHRLPDYPLSSEPNWVEIIGYD